jgi:hypothetical protein
VVARLRAPPGGNVPPAPPRRFGTRGRYDRGARRRQACKAVGALKSSVWERSEHSYWTPATFTLVTPSAIFGSAAVRVAPAMR